MAGKSREDGRLAAIRRELAALAMRGRLTPAAVVEAASHPSSALHDAFEWDDAKASYSWRLSQARKLIGRVKITVDVEDRTVTVPAYVRDVRKASADQGYTRIERVMSSPNEARALILFEFDRALGALRRAADVAVVLGHEESIRQVELAVAELRGRLEADDERDEEGLAAG